MATKKLRLGQMLVDAGTLTRRQLEEALRAQQIYGGKLGTVLVESGLLTEEFLTSFLTQQFNVPPLPPKALKDVEPAALKMVNPTFAAEHQIFPFGKQKRYLDVAIADPADVKSLDELAFQTGLLIRPYVAPEATILDALERYYRLPKPRRYIGVGSSVSGKKGSPSGLDVDSGIRDVESGEKLPRVDLDLPLRQSGVTPIGVPEVFPDRPLSLLQAVIEMQSIHASSQVAELILRFSRPYFKKRGIFALRADCFQLMIGEGPGQFATKTKNAKIPLDTENVVRTVLETKQHYFGVLPESLGNRRMLEQLGESETSPALVMPLVYNQRVELIFLGTAVIDHDFTPTSIQKFQVLMEKASLAHQLLLIKKRMMLFPKELY